MNYKMNPFCLQKLEVFPFIVQDALLGISIFLTFTQCYANVGILQEEVFTRRQYCNSHVSFF